MSLRGRGNSTPEEDLGLSLCFAMDGMACLRSLPILNTMFECSFHLCHTDVSTKEGTQRRSASWFFQRRAAFSLASETTHQCCCAFIEPR